MSGAKSILCKPAAPTVSIYRTNGKPQLKWSAVTGATKYWIYRSTDGVNFSYYDSTTKTSYTNSGAASGKKYYYRVKAVAVVNGTNVTSANSNTKSLMTPLAKPTVSITTSNGKPKITWKAVTGADKYYVYRSTDGKNFSYYDSTTNASDIGVVDIINQRDKGQPDHHTIKLTQIGQQFILDNIKEIAEYAEQNK